MIPAIFCVTQNKLSKISHIVQKKNKQKTRNKCYMDVQMENIYTKYKFKKTNS